MMTTTLDTEIDRQTEPSSPSGYPALAGADRGGLRDLVEPLRQPLASRVTGDPTPDCAARAVRARRQPHPRAGLRAGRADRAPRPAGRAQPALRGRRHLRPGPRRARGAGLRRARRRARRGVLRRPTRRRRRHHRRARSHPDHHRRGPLPPARLTRVAGEEQVLPHRRVPRHRQAGACPVDLEERADPGLVLGAQPPHLARGGVGGRPPLPPDAAFYICRHVLPAPPARDRRPDRQRDPAGARLPRRDPVLLRRLADHRAGAAPDGR